LFKVKDLLHYTTGPVTSAFLGLLITPLLAWTFSMEDVGRVSIYHLISNLVVMVLTLGLDQYYMREYYKAEKANLLITCITPSIIALCIFSYVFYMYRVSILQYLFEMKNDAIAIILVSSFMVTLLNRYLSLNLRMEGKALKFSFSQIIPKLVISLALVSIFYLNDVMFDDLLYIYLLSNVVLLVYLLIENIKVYNFLNLFEIYKLSFKNLKDAFSFGLPLILSGLAFWGLTSIDKLMIKDLSSLNELALYSVAVSFASAVVILRSVFSTIWAPAVYKNEDHPDIEKNIRSVVSLMGVVIFYLFCIVGIFSPLVSIILPDNYELVSSIIICCVGYPLFYTMSEATSMGINVKKKTYYSMLISILTLGVNFVLNYLLIPYLGSGGAAVATLISFYIYYVLRCEISSRIWVSFPRFRQYFEFLIVISLCTLQVVFHDFSPFLKVLVWLTVLIFYTFFYRSYLYLQYSKLIKLLNKRVKV